MSETNMLPPDEGPGLKIPILFVLVLGLVAGNVYMFLQLDQMKTDLASMKDSILTEVSSVRESASISSQTSRRHIDTLTASLEAQRRQAAQAVGQAKEEALRQVDELSKELASANKKQKAEVQAELARVEQAAASKVAEVSTEVGNVKMDVATSKAELDKTIADLKRTNGDLGVQSGLIATNGKELQALKQLGERSYYEFNLVKTDKPFRLNDITIQLKKVDEKRNKYSIDLVTDDKKTEKKDKNVNEPLQFYMAKYRQPCEIVVNEVKKDRIIGYLSQPKVVTAR
jgi:hypothetical protein